MQAEMEIKIPSCLKFWRRMIMFQEVPRLVGDGFSENDTAQLSTWNYYNLLSLSCPTKSGPCTNANPSVGLVNCEIPGAKDHKWECCATRLIKTCWVTTASQVLLCSAALICCTSWWMFEWKHLEGENGMRAYRNFYSFLINHRSR